MRATQFLKPYGDFLIRESLCELWQCYRLNPQVNSQQSTQRDHALPSNVRLAVLQHIDP
jgi:hypothetical protein